jgi:hypothetical protein
MRMMALPAWLKLQEASTWHQILGVTQVWRSPRTLQAFGVGLPKTGTVSLANLLSTNYRSSHEPETWILTHLLKGTTLGTDRKMTLEERIGVLRARDQLLNLNFESNFVLGLLIETLYSSFPDAKYILTIRDCYSWVNSEINQQYISSHISPWDFLYDYRYGLQRYYQPEDICLKEYNLHPLSSYFSYWAGHIKTVLDTIPHDQLLVIRTKDLSSRTNDIANFLEISFDRMMLSKSHSHRRRNKALNILDLIDKNFLEYNASIFCKDIMMEYFGSMNADKSINNF